MARGPVAPRRFATTPQVAVDTLATTASPWATLGLPADATLDARLLVITADGTDPAYTTIVEALRYAGTPFDTFNATTEPELTADRLATGNHGHYYGVILDRGNLSTGATSAFTANEWMVLSAYEAQFQVRRAALYAYPEAIYGLAASSAGGFDTTTVPLAIHCSDAGAALFTESNCGAGISVSKAWAYPATVTGSTTVPVLVDDAGRVFGALFTDAGQREYLALTFAQAPSLVHSLSIIHDVVRWVTRGVFLGERHVYLTSQIDDLFLSSDIYPFCSDCGGSVVDAAAGGGPVSTIGDGGTVDGLTYRITELDLQALADWQLGPRGNPLTADLRLDWALNGFGSTDSDPLTIRARALGSAFKWISHTWDHANLDEMSYADALLEFTRNDARVGALGLQPYDARNLVTPSVSGLDNPEVLRAAFDAGIRFLVGDTSVPGWDNPSPNAGMYSQSQPAILIIPRRPTNLFYNVSTPDKWQEEYNAIYHAYWQRDLSYEEILDFESDVLLQDLLRGATDPWMFHQANTRDYGGGHSLLSDLHDRLLAKYARTSKLPIVSDTMDAVGARAGRRMKYDAAQATAVIGPGAQITVRVLNAATVPVTGLCAAAAESYAGQKISFLELAAGAAVTLSLDDCGPGAGGSGAGGASGTGGVAGTGGAVAGTGGVVGVGGAVGIGGAVAGTGGAVGIGGAVGTGGAGTGGDFGSGGAVGIGGAVGTGGAVSGAGGAGGAGNGIGGAVSGTGGGGGIGGAVSGTGGGGGIGGDLGTGGAVSGTGSGGIGGVGAGGVSGTGGNLAGGGGDLGSTGVGTGGASAPIDAGPLGGPPSSAGCACALAETSPASPAFSLLFAMVAGALSWRRRRRTCRA